MWKAHNCIKIEDCLFLNQRGVRSEGPRSASGTEWSSTVSRLIEEARGNKTSFRDGYHFPISDTHFRKATMELGHIPLCLDVCNRKRIAVDCGAHVGGWSKELANHFDKVISYEASSDNYECLLKNTEGLNVDARNLGVGEKAGMGSLHPPVNPGNSGAAWVVDGDDFEVITLDSQNLENVDFIKIDVEGFEPQVLRGAEETIKRDRPVVLIEQHPLIDGRYGEYREAGALLEGWGYRLEEQMNKNYLYVPN